MSVIILIVKVGAFVIIVVGSVELTKEEGAFVINVIGIEVFIIFIVV